MNITSRKVAAPALSLLMVAGGGASTLIGSGALADEAYANDAASQATVAESGQQAAESVQSRTVVSGTFAYDQATTTSTADLSSIFAKAAATLCTSMPDYGTHCLATYLQVKAPGCSLEAPVSDLAADDDATSYTMACSCASNVAGGGAIANAEVSGVSLASVAKAAGVR